MGCLGCSKHNDEANLGSETSKHYKEGKWETKPPQRCVGLSVCMMRIHARTIDDTLLDIALTVHDCAPLTVLGLCPA